MKRTTLPQAAELLTLDVILVRCHLTKALEHLDECTRGFPTGGTGNSDHPDAVQGSIVERLAAIGPDRAETDLKRLCELMDAGGKALHDLGALCQSWAQGTVGGVRNMGKADDDLYCPHCAAHNVRDSLRSPGRKLCARCYRVQRLYGVLPNAALYEKWRAGHERFDPDVVARILGVTKRRDVA